MSFLNDKDKENEKNISVTLVTPDDSEKNAIVISFSEMWKYAKKFFALWISLAVVAAFVSVGIAYAFQKSFYFGDATALIGLNYDGIDEGLDPNGDELDITKIKSPSVIENALTNLDMNIEQSDIIRQNLNITGVVPEDAMDEMSMYYDVFTNGNNSALQAAQSILDSKFYPSKYLVTFNYFKAGFSFEEGKEILNEVLNSYRSYFFETYNYNVALGSSVSIVDYTTYDYAEAVNIFSNSIDSVTDYLNNLKQGDTSNFRSSATGYSFDDLLAEASLIKNNDLDRTSSYVTINNITKNDKDSMVSYYKYLVEQLERKKAVSTSTLNSINDSIASYEKDPLIMVVGSDNESSTEENGKPVTKDVNKAYDELVSQKIDTQKTISSYSKSIRYYNSIISAFNKSKSSSKEEIAKAEDYLSVLNDRLQKLIDNTNKTAEEYYSNVAFANAYKVLVPASGSQKEVVSSNVKMPVLISEALLFVIYLGIIVVGSIVSVNKKKKEEIIENPSNIDNETCE